MHVFDAGLFQTHCWQVWGIDTTALSGNGLISWSIATTRPSDFEFEKWYEVIHTTKDPEELREKLKGYSHDALWHICNNNDLCCAGTKLQLAGAIVERVCHMNIKNGACAYTYVHCSSIRLSHLTKYNFPSSVPQSPCHRLHPPLLKLILIMRRTESLEAREREAWLWMTL